MLSTLVLTAFASWAVPAGWVDAIVTRRATKAVVVERSVVIDLAIRTGDPLGSRAEGTLKTLSEPKLVVGHKKTGVVRAGGQQAVIGTDGQIQLEPVGIAVEVTPHLRLDGKILIDALFTETEVNEGRGVKTTTGFTPGIDTTQRRVSAIVSPGHRIKVRLSSRSAADQTWVEIEAAIQEPAGAPVK